MTIEDMLKELGDVYRQISPSKPDEVSWKVCVLMSDGKVQKQDAASLYLASATMNDYLTLGTAAWIEGPLPPKGSKVTVLEDVITTGGSANLVFI